MRAIRTDYLFAVQVVSEAPILALLLRLASSGRLSSFALRIMPVIIVEHHCLVIRVVVDSSRRLLLDFVVTFLATSPHQPPFQFL